MKVGAGALAAPLLMGCSDSAAEPGAPAPDPRLTARPGSPSVAPVLGVSPLGLGGDRDGFLYVPESYTPSTPALLLVVLHGAAGSGGYWQSFVPRARALGLALLAPDSRGVTWDLLEGRFGPDIDFIDAALEHTFARVRVNPFRILLGGFSDGAGYAMSIGVSNGDLFSHLCAYSPGFFIPSEPLVGKPPMYVSHGTQDAILPVSLSRDEIVPNFRSSGYDVTYEEFAGGHSLPAAIADSSLKWFLA